MSFGGNNKFKVQQNNPKVAAILEDSSNSNILRVRKLQKFPRSSSASFTSGKGNSKGFIVAVNFKLPSDFLPLNLPRRRRRIVLTCK